jgi:hypothetical protein
MLYNYCYNNCYCMIPTTAGTTCTAAVNSSSQCRAVVTQSMLGCCQSLQVHTYSVITRLIVSLLAVSLLTASLKACWDVVKACRYRRYTFDSFKFPKFQSSSSHLELVPHIGILTMMHTYSILSYILDSFTFGQFHCLKLHFKQVY